MWTIIVLSPSSRSNIWICACKLVKWKNSECTSKCIAATHVHEKPEKTGTDGLDSLETIPDAVPVVLTKPPIEEQLAWHTLWPESHKLYGHGNELYSLCCDHEGKLLASSCKVVCIAFELLCHYYNFHPHFYFSSYLSFESTWTWSTCLMSHFGINIGESTMQVCAYDPLVVYKLVRCDFSIVHVALGKATHKYA